jgi:hypothetical protein
MRAISGSKVAITVNEVLTVSRRERTVLRRRAHARGSASLA